MPRGTNGTGKPPVRRCVTNQSIGLIDTNILIPALANDAQGADCRAFLEQVQEGGREVLLTTVVVHEFTYAMSRFAKQMTRVDIGGYLISLMSLPNVRVDDGFLFDTVRRWAHATDLGFVDAYLSIRAEQDRIPVYTRNLRHFERFGVEIPDSLLR